VVNLCDRVSKIDLSLLHYKALTRGRTD